MRYVAQWLLWHCWRMWQRIRREQNFRDQQDPLLCLITFFSLQPHPHLLRQQHLHYLPHAATLEPFWHWWPRHCVRQIIQPSSSPPSRQELLPHTEWNLQTSLSQLSSQWFKGVPPLSNFVAIEKQQPICYGLKLLVVRCVRRLRVFYLSW